MAQLLPPVRCTDPIKFPQTLFQNHNGIVCCATSSSSGGGGSRWSFTAENIALNGGRHKRKRGFVRVHVATDDQGAPAFYSGDAVADDYYAVLGLLPDATPEQIKKAYYNCMKACHPDLSGNDSDTTNFCMFINEVYAVLSDPVQRKVYDEIHGYALTAINPFLDDTYPKDHVFVDEFSCIGCKNCANVCSDVFSIEEDFGRARVYNQPGNPDFVEEAIESCPVDCIHRITAAQLSLLEDEMRRVERVNVALMLAGMGSSADVFRMASTRWEKRQSKVLEEARIRMMRQKDSHQPESYWGNMWGKEKEYQSTEEEMKERASRAAAAARRWREYSRRGVDKPTTYKLPEAVSNKDQ